MKNLKKIIIIIFIPIVLIKDTVRSERSIIRKLGYLLLVIIIFGFVWLNSVFEIKDLITYSLFQSGVTDKLHEVKINGTSMLPTIKNGETVTLNSPKKYKLERGDIVSFSNTETNNNYYIKRIVGMPSESISIKNGYYYINGQALDESYTLNNIPTYGNTFLSDCEIVSVPENSFFVSGDNRTVSFDSRAIGFVHKDDIEGIIKKNTIEKFLSSPVQINLLEKNIDPVKFLDNLNKKRVENGVSPIVTHEVLNNLASSRAGEIKDNFNDWKNNNIPVDKLLDQSFYRYNLIHEFVTFGYLSEEDIVNQIFDSIVEKDEFLSSQYTEVGIGVATREFEECSYPIVSIILSWPVAPTYDKEVLEAWNQEIEFNNSYLLSLQTQVGSPNINQEKLRTLINTLSRMQQIAQRIYDKQKNQEWLTQKDYNDIKLYDNLANGTFTLDEELFGNSNVKGASTKDENVRRF